MKVTGGQQFQRSNKAFVCWAQDNTISTILTKHIILVLSTILSTIHLLKLTTMAALINRWLTARNSPLPHTNPLHVFVFPQILLFHVVRDVFLKKSTYYGHHPNWVHELWDCLPKLLQTFFKAKNHRHMCTKETTWSIHQSSTFGVWVIQTVSNLTLHGRFLFIHFCIGT